MSERDILSFQKQLKDLRTVENELLDKTKNVSVIFTLIEDCGLRNNDLKNQIDVVDRKIVAMTKLLETASINDNTNSLILYQRKLEIINIVLDSLTLEVEMLEKTNLLGKEQYKEAINQMNVQKKHFQLLQSKVIDFANKLNENIDKYLNEIQVDLTREESSKEISRFKSHNAKELETKSKNMLNDLNLQMAFKRSQLNDVKTKKELLKNVLDASQNDIDLAKVHVNNCKRKQILIETFNAQEVLKAKQKQNNIDSLNYQSVCEDALKKNQIVTEAIKSFEEYMLSTNMIMQQAKKLSIIFNKKDDILKEKTKKIYLLTTQKQVQKNEILVFLKVQKKVDFTI